MSVKKTLSLTRGDGKKKSSVAPTRKTHSLNRHNGDDNDAPEVGAVTSAKRGRMGSCFSFKEINVEMPPGGKSLKDVDSNKLKAEIKRWARNVVRYARQLSDRLSPRSSSSGSSSG